MTTSDKILRVASDLKTGSAGSIQKALTVLQALAEYALERVDANWERIRRVLD